MKRTLSMIAFATLTVGLLGSCSKINERLDNLDKRIDGLENEQIASINSQIDGIKTSIADLGTIRSDISSLKQSASDHSVDIFNLEEADRALKDRILNLEEYVDAVLPNYAEKEWVEATFSTLQQYEATCDTIAKIDARIGALDTKLSKDIKACADSLTKWVNKTFEGYYTAAEMDASLAQMKSDIDSARAANKISDAKADSIATELTNAKAAVDTAKANIRAEYRAAIDTAIKVSEGKLTKELTDKITTANTAITNLTTRVTNLENEVDKLTGRVEALEGMIQSVTIVPAYSDGSVDATKDGILYLDIIVEPAAAVAGLTKDNFKVLVNEVKTKSVMVDTVAVEDISVDAAKGTVTARANILSKLPESGKALTIALNVWKGKSDYTTNFYPVEASSESNVTITDATEATKVSIKADEDFPESVMGNIGVAEGFKDTKPTSVSIPMPSLKVDGIGTVIFDKDATAKIKANAEQAGATSVFFKVEDVTTTKPVENADVVLEVTMKTVDEQGTEVFCEGKADGEVTIQIPMDENVVYVNSVTLVNDAGDPIEGGVVPGSEIIENGILTFKVNHFSKYAIDYVTKAEYKAVTGVSIEPVSVTLQVGDTLRLVATIAPEDATNKKVTWSSDTTKVKVDDTGKITAVAFGQTTITVTTKDGGKTATCKVKVTETKTMVEILKTNSGIPESQDLTPPANAWVNSTDPDCKAFVGIDAEEDTLFVIKKGELSNPPAVCMDDEFEKIDDNTYKRTEPDFTFTVKMTEGKFTSLEFNTNIEGIKFLNGTYSAPVSVTFVNPEGDVISTMPATQYILNGSMATKPSDPTDNTPGNSGFHTLAGWYKTKDATTGELSDKWDFNNVVTEDITLYAQWQTKIEKIIGKAAAQFPFKNIEEDTTNPKYVKDEMTWVGGTDQICYGALYLNTGNRTIFVHGSTRCEGAYYSSNCLKTGIAYKYDGTRAIYTFYIEGGVFTKMVFEAKDPSSTVGYCNGTYTPPTK